MSALNPQQFNLYRAEARPPEDDLSAPESVGVHWTNRPIDYGYNYVPGHQQVVWHATVPSEHVADTTDRFGEGEVVLRNGAQVRLSGRSVTRGKDGIVSVRPEPEIPMDHAVTIKGRQIK